jgi:hypothetical protein
MGSQRQPDSLAEPLGVAKGQAGEIEQQQPGVAGNGGVAPRGQARLRRAKNPAGGLRTVLAGLGWPVVLLSSHGGGSLS